jgi:hypothetical protein
VDVTGRFEDRAHPDPQAGENVLAVEFVIDKENPGARSVR